MKKHIEAKHLGCQCQPPLLLLLQPHCKYSNICGKEAGSNDMRKHIEAKHFSYQCQCTVQLPLRGSHSRSAKGTKYEVKQARRAQRAAS